MLRHHGEEARAAVCNELLIKLAENRFTLAVVGQFKRGKSSLINALVGREIVPTGALPVTSAITILRYGSRDRLIVRYVGSHLTGEAPLESLADFVTEAGNPGNRKRIEAVYLETPVRFLRRGLEFVDTPGIGSSIEANTRTTYDFIPRCDAVLLVTSVEAAFSSAEIEFLRTIRGYVHKVFFVLNKTDLLPECEVDEVSNFARSTLRRELGSDALAVFCLSCRQAIKDAADGSPSTASGLPVLQDTIARFLSNESERTLLKSILDRANRLCSDASEHCPAIRTDEWSGVTRRLADLASGRGLDSALALAPLPAGATEDLRPSDEPPPVSPPPSELQTLLRTRGCPVCDYAANVAFEHFRHFQYELATQESAQRRFADRRGLCSKHAWQLGAMISPQGASSGLAPLVDRVATELLNRASSADRWDVSKLVTCPAQCALCELVDGATREIISRLAEFISGPTGSRAYAASHGLCLKHLAQLLAALEAPSMRRFVLEEAARRFSETAEDLRAYVLKRDALRSGFLHGDEEDAYRRALVHLFGDKRVVTDELWGDR